MTTTGKAIFLHTISFVTTITLPDPLIFNAVRSALLRLLQRVAARLTPAESLRFSEDAATQWLPREQQAFNVSIAAVGLISKTIEAEKILSEHLGHPYFTDKEFAAGLLLEYVALSEGVFKLQLKHVAILGSFLNVPVVIDGRSMLARSYRNLERPDVYVETLVQCARRLGFGIVLRGVFSNKVRRAIAHMDVGIDDAGNVSLYDTRKSGQRVLLGPPKSILEMQQMNWALRDFCHSFVLVLQEYIGAQFGMGHGA